MSHIRRRPSVSSATTADKPSPPPVIQQQHFDHHHYHQTQVRVVKRFHWGHAFLSGATGAAAAGASWLAIAHYHFHW